ncbi:GRF1-interacting factor 1-like [Hibiscus syriacus]|uniref:GRF1-interacting factor 1-like n=1 Tax=Hibiscus syriacus TaxID=106335 RepID=UPI001924F4C7|nr:GRF1-interacting factor 1-like [Hibiscus syriacus]
MRQHLMQTQPMVAAYYPNNVTTVHIQQYLNENKALILKIVESQNSGKLSECAENIARLQQNLMYLSAVADSQPQPPPLHAQVQAQPMTPHSLMASQASMLYAPQPFSALQQQQQALLSQVGMSSGGCTGHNILQSEASTAGGSGGALGDAGFPDFVRVSSGVGMLRGSKLDMGSSVVPPEGQ